jgi:hypothetical protein
MGFFGVASVGEPASAPTIEHCHLNLWVLGGLLGYRVCYLDVGLAMQAGEAPVKEIKVGVPAATDEAPGRAIDSLARELADPVIAGLIFARRDVLHDGRLKVTPREQMRILDIDRPNCKLAEQPRHPFFSLWTLQLNEPLPMGESGYLRVRFRIRNPGRLWVWQRSLLSRNRAIADLRVNDERESRSVTDISAFSSNLLSLRSLNSFVIAPAIFNPAVTTPEPSYVRGLEGRVWEPYLGRRTDMRRNQKFLVHRWEAAPVPVSSEEPFRGFLQLERRRSLLPSWSDLMPVIIALVAADLLFDLRGRSLHWAEDAISSLGEFLFSGFPAPSGAYVAIVVVLAMLAFAGQLRTLIRNLRGIGGRLDDWIYSVGFGRD